MNRLYDGSQNFMGQTWPGYKTESDLEYTIEKAENAIVFQVSKQSKRLTNALVTLQESGQVFVASNGVRVAVSDFPEYKLTQNVIYLRGTDYVNNSKPDITKTGSNTQRDGLIKLMERALKEVVEFIEAIDYLQRPQSFTSGYPVQVTKIIRL